MGFQRDVRGQTYCGTGKAGASWMGEDGSTYMGQTGDCAAMGSGGSCPGFRLEVTDDGDCML